MKQRGWFIIKKDRREENGIIRFYYELGKREY